MTLSKHVQWDRTDRISFIKNTIGFGELVAEHESFKGGYRGLTSTGVIIIMDEKHEKVITAYIANVQQAVSTYCIATKQEKVPSELFQTILRNRPLRAEQP